MCPNPNHRAVNAALRPALAQSISDAFLNDGLQTMLCHSPQDVADFLLSASPAQAAGFALSMHERLS